MINHNTTPRRLAGFLARTGVVASSTMLAISCWTMVSTSLHAASAAPTSGDAQVIVPRDGRIGAGQPLTRGGSATEFSLGLPAGAACSGDSANSNPSYLVQSYMVKSSVDPASLTFDANGPMPQATGANFRYSLFNAATTDSYVNINTGPASPPPGPGPVPDLPAFSLKVFASGDIPAGTYNIGVACTHGPASAAQLDKFWNAQIDVTASSSDQPAGITWTAQATQSSSTSAGDGSSTSSSSTVEGSGSTTSSTAAADSTTSTVAGDTSSTAAGDPPAESGGYNGGDPSSGSTGGGSLATTGAASIPVAIWGALLLIFGRMAVLLGRATEVRVTAGDE